MATAERSTARLADSAHVVLGLPSQERDPARITEAAARRLEALNIAGGSEIAVRRALASLIRSARDELLRAAGDR